MLQGILIVCWIIFLVYWLVSSWFVKPTQEAVWNVNKIRLVLIIIAIFVFVIGRLDLFSLLRGRVCPNEGQGCQYNLFVSSTYVPQDVKVFGVVLTVIGLVIAIVARKILADNWSGAIEFKKNHTLITSGIYKYMRHPIYTGILAMGLGAVLFYETPGLIFVSLLVCGVLIFKLRKEEQLMLKHFPKEYTTYKKRVKALIPFLV